MNRHDECMVAKSGYTLIELIVVVGIIAVISAGGLISFSTFNQKQKVAEGKKQLVSDLKLFKKKADAGEGSDQCQVGSEQYYGLGVEIFDNGSDANIVVTVLCKNSMGNVVIKNPVYKREYVGLKSNSPDSTQYDFALLALSQGIDLHGNGDSYSLTDGTSFETITITAGGSIY